MGIYQRSEGGVWYGRWHKEGRYYRRSLHTRDREEAQEKFYRLAGGGSLRRRGRRSTWKGPCAVYLIQSGDAVKVGIARNVSARLRTIQAHNPELVRMQHVIQCSSEQGARSLEAQLHQRLGPYLVHGEWFKPAEIVLQIAKVEEIAQ